ncbi:MAG: hypothetical protein WCP36_02025 [Methanomicrobiales archaeon]
MGIWGSETGGNTIASGIPERGGTVSVSIVKVAKPEFLPDEVS